jgi:hypothetical protein
VHLIEGSETVDDGVLGRASTDLVRRLVAVGIDGFGPLPSAARAAAKVRASTASEDDAIEALIWSATRSVAVGGFLTGLGGFVTVPVALPANVLGYYVVATRTVAGIAALRGYDLARADVRSAVMLAMVEADAQSLLTRFGVSGHGGVVTGLVSGQLSVPAQMVLDKGVGFQLLSRLGRSTLGRFGRGVPLAGGLVGAASDAWMLRRTARAAMTAFPEQPPQGRGSLDGAPHELDGGLP